MTGTRWTKLYLHPAGQTLADAPPSRESTVTYGGLSDGVTFLTPPLDAETEITGPIVAKLFVSSETTDADLFLVLRVFTPDLKEVTFHGALDPHTPIAQGWLRASHRKLDSALTLPYRPYHSHDEIQPLVPGQVYELDVEVWPTCIVVPRGYRIGLTVRGKDYVYPGAPARGWASSARSSPASGPFQHAEARDRPPEIFGGKVTLHAGPEPARAHPAADHPVRPVGGRARETSRTREEGACRRSDGATSPWKPIDPEHSSGSGSVYQGASIEVARVTYPAGTRIAAHATPHEAVHSILRGRARFRVGGREQLVGAGEAILVRANVLHSAEILDDLEVVTFRDMKPDPDGGPADPAAPAFYKWDEMESDLITPKYSASRGPTLLGDRMEVVYMYFPAGTEGKLHSHPNEQLQVVLHGKAIAVIEGEEFTMVPGTALSNSS